MVAFTLPGQSAKGDQPKLFQLQDFGSLNTQATRPGIGDNEFSWNENWQPIGKSNMRTLYGKGSTLYTAPSGKTIVFFFNFNIGTTSYIAVFLSDGTADQVKVSDGTVVHISTNSGTFFSAGGDIPACAQWGNSGILIVSTVSANGYWAWDEAGGGTLYPPNSAAPLWLNGLAETLTPTGNTNSNTTVNSMSSTTGIVIGMTVTSSANDIPANTTVTAIGSGQVTISQAATGTHSNVTLTFTWDMPAGLSGTSVEVFQSRVWVANANNANVTFSAPSNGADFSTADGGGTIKSSDSFLRQGFHCVKQANGFLYLFGDSSINVISNVQTSGSPATTTFNNQNTDPQMGTPWPNTVQAFGRALLFANPSGVYALYGGAAEKVSSQLDGLFANATLPVGAPVATNYPCSAVMTINGVKCYMIRINALDPFTNAHRNLMAIWDGRKWFQGSQETAPIFIGTQEVNSVISAWGTDTNILFPMFSTPSSTLTKKWQGKLWAGTSPIIYKNALRLYTEAEDNAGTGLALSITIDNQNSSVTASVTSSNVLQFQNNSGGNLQFQNNSSGNLNFVVGGLSIIGQDIDARGLLMGMTVSTTSQDVTYIMAALAYQEQAPYA